MSITKSAKTEKVQQILRGFASSVKTDLPKVVTSVGATTVIPEVTRIIAEGAGKSYGDSAFIDAAKKATVLGVTVVNLVGTYSSAIQNVLYKPDETLDTIIPEEIKRLIAQVESAQANYKGLSSASVPRGAIRHFRRPNDIFLEFPFNPAPIEDTKNNTFFDIVKLGEPTPPSLWVEGGARELSFELYFDATLSSRLSAGSRRIANTGQQVSAGEEEIRNPFNSRASGVPVAEEGGLNSFSQLAEYIARTKESTTLADMYLLKTFEYPEETNATRFYTSGVPTRTNRFTSLPKLIFTYGSTCLVGWLKKASFKHEAFNQSLNPVRTRANITILVDENYVVDRTTFAPTLTL